LFNEPFSLYGIVGIGNRGRPILYYRSIEGVRLRRSGLQVGDRDYVMDFPRSGDIQPQYQSVDFLRDLKGPDTLLLEL